MEITAVRYRALGGCFRLKTFIGENQEEQVNEFLVNTKPFIHQIYKYKKEEQ